jgi:hypothetical protein
MFSISASSSDSASPCGRTSAGMRSNPAMRAARQRRSPAISSYVPPATGRRSTGWRTPRSRSESASATSDVSSKSVRGCRGLGAISSTATSRSSGSRAASSLPGAVEARIAARPRPMPRVGSAT